MISWNKSISAYPSVILNCDSSYWCSSSPGGGREAILVIGDIKTGFSCGWWEGMFGGILIEPQRGLVLNWNFTLILLFTLKLKSPPPLMGCGAAEATGLGFVCFVVINLHVLSANRIDFGLFFFIYFPNSLPHLQSLAIGVANRLRASNYDLNSFATYTADVGGGALFISIVMTDETNCQIVIVNNYEIMLRVGCYNFNDWMMILSSFKHLSWAGTTPV